MPVVDARSVTSRLLLCCVVFVLATAPAYAADPKAAARDDEAAVIGQSAPPKYNEIERGLWVALETAPIAHLDWVSTIPPTRLPRQLLPDDGGLGWRMGGRVGFDIARLFSIDGFAMGQFREKRIRRGRSFAGDLTDFSTGLGIRLMPITIKDRLAFTGRASLGMALLLPGEVARANTNPGCLPPGNAQDAINPLCVAFPTIKTPENPVGFQPFPGTVIAVSPMAEFMVGAEYFTKLRHFSVGAELVGGVLAWPFQLHVGLVPHVKYTF